MIRARFGLVLVAGALAAGPGTITTIAPITARALAVDGAGDVFVLDAAGRQIRKLGGGVVATVPAGAQGLAVDANGNVYFADTNRVREVDRNGIVRTVPGTETGLSAPTGVAVGPTRAVYVADSGNGRVRRVDDGRATTLAGDLAGLAGIAVDANGNVCVTAGQRVLKIDSQGAVTTLARGLAAPRGLAVGADGAVYVAAAGGNRIRKIAGGRITTVAGTGAAGSAGDGGPATSAELSAPSGVAVDAHGNLYVADTGNGRVRRVEAGSPPPPPPPPRPPRPHGGTAIAFQMPAAGVTCTMVDGTKRPRVHCRSWGRPQRDVQLRPNGTYTTCLSRCGPFQLDTPLSVSAGTDLAVGRFACTTLPARVRCIVRRSGQGFEINRAAVRRV
jgi:streptogramin lyase